MVNRRKPKPPAHKKTWGDVIAAGTLGGVTWLSTIATPDNVSWLLAHGGRLLTTIAALLTTAKCVFDWWPRKKT